MSTAEAESRAGRVEFTGSRHELMLIMLRGYALMIPTIGLYRFWQATWKRRFYWQNTVIDGDPLEYTGTPSQLLFGFLFALAFFLPIYVAFFYASMQDAAVTIYVYVAAGAALWFLAGYGIYRARDFRLSRTLWRGVRFDMRGNAWAYALRRFVWSILMVVTLGLIYPWMGSSLWRYRWRNTWYGDRRFEISGNWRAFALPYYVTFFINLIAITATTVWIVARHDLVQLDNLTIPGPVGLLGCAGCVLLFALTLAWYRSMVAARMLSTVTLGDASLTVTLPPFSLFGQFAAYAIGLVALLLVLTLTVLLVFAAIYLVAPQSGRAAEATLVGLVQSGTVTVTLLIAAYLIVLGALGMLWELIPGIGWWRLLAKGTTIANVESLRTVKAMPEDRTLVGQGLADALNVGAY
jgi:uncharacterized membrane protein YjgN (DUF898 family)